MNTDKFASLSFILTPICWVLRVIIVAFYSCAISYEYVSHKIQSLLSKNKKTNYDELEKILSSNDVLLKEFKMTYTFSDMYKSLSFRDKLKIKTGSMTWPQVGLSEEIENMSAHDFVIIWKEFLEK